MENFGKVEGVEGIEKEDKSEQITHEVAGGNKLISARAFVLFVLGILIGITLKTYATQTITIGYEDYKLQGFQSDFKKDDSLEVEEDAEMVDDAEEVLSGDDEAESLEEPVETSDEAVGDQGVEE